MSDFQHVSTSPRADQLARQHGPARDGLDLRSDGIEQRGDQASRALSSHHRCDALGAMLELDREGFEIIVSPVQESGLVELAVFKAALQPGAVFASVTFVDKDTRVTQDIAAIGALCRARDILLRVDAAHAADKISIDLAAFPVDLMSFARSQDQRIQRHWRTVCGAPPRMRIGVNCTAASTHQVVKELLLPRSRSTARFSPRTRSRRTCLTFARARRF
ncbi:Cysteine desulfurase IscS [Paraburkholderia kirstenboschensis]|nr:Cysteine desulfurase IscS [Paraburkholderia kirstenboschensis]